MIGFIKEIYLIWRNDVTLAFHCGAKARQNLAKCFLFRTCGEEGNADGDAFTV